MCGFGGAERLALAWDGGCGESVLCGPQAGARQKIVFHAGAGKLLEIPISKPIVEGGANVLAVHVSNPGNTDGYATYGAAVAAYALPGQPVRRRRSSVCECWPPELGPRLPAGGWNARPAGFHGGNAQQFKFRASNIRVGVSTGAAPNNIGFGNDASNYFYVQANTFDTNTADPNFSFMSYGSATSPTVVTLLTSGGQTYDKIYVGKVTYTFTNTAPPGWGHDRYSCTLPRPRSVEPNAAYWMEDGQVYVGAADASGYPVGTISTLTAPIHVTLFGTPVIPEPGTLALLAAGVLALVPTIRRRLCKTT